MSDIALILPQRTASTARRLAATLFLLLVLVGCDENDGEWEGTPTEPSPQPSPSVLSVSVDHEPAVDDHVNAGEPVIFRVDVVNAGPGAADSVAVLVAIPEQVDLEDTDASSGRFEEATDLWLVGRVESGASGHLLVNAWVPEGTVGEELVFTASLAAATPADSTARDNSASVRIPVVNHPPDADDDAFVLAEGAVLTVPGPGLLSNDLDHGGEEIYLDLEPVGGPFRGELTLLGSGGFTYDHDGSEAVADSFRYRITDASAESDTATVRLEILLVNDLPAFVEFAGFTIAEGDTFAPVALRELAHDDDHSAEELVWQVLNADALTIAVSEDDILTVTTPGPDWYGTDELLFRVRDPEGAVANAHVPFTVESVNDPPVVSALPAQAVAIGGDFLPVPLDGYVADIDHDDDEIVWTVRDHEPLLVTISPLRVLTVTAPNPSWTGSVSITLRATDGAGDWDERTCRFEVVDAR